MVFQVASKGRWSISSGCTDQWQCLQLDLPSEHNVSTAFDVSDICPFDVGEDLMMNCFEERGNDENHQGNTIKASTDPLHIFRDPITRARAKKIIKLTFQCNS